MKKTFLKCSGTLGLAFALGLALPAIAADGVNTVSGNLPIGAGGNVVITVTPNGRVGVNNTNPGAAVDLAPVAGDANTVNITGNVNVTGGSVMVTGDNRACGTAATNSTTQAARGSLKWVPGAGRFEVCYINTAGAPAWISLAELILGKSLATTVQGVCADYTNPNGTHTNTGAGVYTLSGTNCGCPAGYAGMGLGGIATTSGAGGSLGLVFCVKTAN